jgi:hypothetical protein
MPVYQFHNKDTNKIEEYSMSYKDLDQFKKDNEHLEVYFSVESLPVLSDGMRLSTPGTGKPDSTFEKYVIGRIRDSVPGNTIAASHKTRIPREY